VDIHFLHVRSPNPDAFPVVMTHGWPGSVVEFLEVIDPLVDPGSHGGDPADALHLILPSLPGFGFSGKPTETGWTHKRIASAWAELMARLGYERYGAQGGDWGGVVLTKTVTDLGVRPPRRRCSVRRLEPPLGSAVHHNDRCWRRKLSPIPK
jgi:pimeloyl-ACP methyl ester carboxylesterase